MLSAFQAHEGPCWSVAWAHPRFDQVLASCGYDNFVKVWVKNQNTWTVVF